MTNSFLAKAIAYFLFAIYVNIFTFASMAIAGCLLSALVWLLNKLKR